MKGVQKVHKTAVEKVAAKVGMWDHEWAVPWGVEWESQRVAETGFASAGPWASRMDSSTAA